jgi:hypothetical protein
MFRSASRSFLVILLGVLVLMRGSTGAPNAQVEFIPNLSNVAASAPADVAHQDGFHKSSESKSDFSRNALEKTDKTTYKKYPKPDSFTITNTHLRTFTKIEIPAFFNSAWKLYVLPLVTRAQDPPASRKTEIQTYLNLADSKGFTVNERIENLRTWRLSV